MEPVAPPQSEFPGRIDRQCFQPESASESYRQSGRLRGVPGAGRRAESLRLGRRQAWGRHRVERLGNRLPG